MRLARGAERLVLWLDGHGERRLNGAANHDLGEFGRQLQQKGFRMSGLNLGVAQDVPANAALLLIASPQVDLLPVEVEKVRRYVAGGGNLFWLIDPEPLRGLQPVAELLGLVLTPGTVIDPALAPKSGPAGLRAGGGRGLRTASDHERAQSQYAVSLRAAGRARWRAIPGAACPLVQVAQRGWVEVGKLEGSITFDKNRDFPGPVNIATALERMVAATGSSAWWWSATPGFFPTPSSATAATSISASTW